MQAEKRKSGAVHFSPISHRFAITSEGTRARKNKRRGRHSDLERRGRPHFRALSHPYESGAAKRTEEGKLGEEGDFWEISVSFVTAAKIGREERIAKEGEESLQTIDLLVPNLRMESLRGRSRIVQGKEVDHVDG